MKNLPDPASVQLVLSPLACRADHIRHPAAKLAIRPAISCSFAAGMAFLWAKMQVQRKNIFS
jgi:hypothetical protein